MKNDVDKNLTRKEILNEKVENSPVNDSQMNRRKFVELAAASAVAFTIVPAHVYLFLLQPLKEYHGDDQGSLS